MTEQRKQWLKRRRKGIGASEAAAVLGLSPYHSPLSLFYEKTQEISTEDDSELKEWGLLLEPAIAKKYAQTTGRIVTSLRKYTIKTMAGAPEFFCTPDRLTVIENESCPLQLKVSAYFNPKEPELPVHWQVQEQHEMMVLGTRHASFGILVAGRRFYHADIKRNDSFIALLREKLEEFLDLIRRGTPPEADGHRATAEALKRMYPKDRGTAVALSTEAFEYAEELKNVKEAIAKYEAREAFLENHLRAEIADNTWGGFLDGSGFSLKTTKRSGYTVEPKEYRSLKRVTSIPKGLLNDDNSDN